MKSLKKKFRKPKDGGPVFYTCFVFCDSYLFRISDFGFRVSFFEG